MYKYIILIHTLFILCLFSVDLLQMLEFNVSVRFPAASLFTVILALCGKYAFDYICILIFCYLINFKLGVFFLLFLLLIHLTEFYSTLIDSTIFYHTIRHHRFAIFLVNANIINRTQLLILFTCTICFWVDRQK